MQFSMKQKVFSIKQKFNITDMNGEPVYEVEGKLLSFGNKLTVRDMAGNDLVHIHQKVLSLVPKYFIEEEGKEEVELKGHITLLRPHYTLEADDGNWEIRGEFGEHEYEMFRGEELIGTVNKKWFSWGDSYVLTVVHDEDVLRAVGVMIALDCILDAEAAARTATFAAGGAAASAAANKNSDG